MSEFQALNLDLWLTFTYGAIEALFIFSSALFPKSFINEAILSPMWSCCLCQKSDDHNYVDFSLSSPLCSVFVPRPCCFGCCDFAVCFEIRNHNVSSSFTFALGVALIILVLCSSIYILSNCLLFQWGMPLFFFFTKCVDFIHYINWYRHFKMPIFLTD